jgi:hypothetical protein
MAPTYKCLVTSGIAALVLAGCVHAEGPAPMPAETPAPMPTTQPAPPSDSPNPDPGAARPSPEPAADACGAGKLSSYVNQLASDDTLAQIRSAASSQTIRVIRPGDAVTMDFRADRLNVEIGDTGRIRLLRCG